MSLLMRREIKIKVKL